jgi:hypothetical protein
MNSENRVSAQKSGSAQNRGDLSQRFHQLPQIPTHRLAHRRPQNVWVRKNEGGTFRNGTDEPRGRTRPNIPESDRAWCDARACFHTGGTFFQGGK